MRDKLAEAKSWLTNPSRLDKTEMIEALKGVPDETLVRAYDIWWSTYSLGIQRAPSNRKIDGIQQGVSEKDATAASEAATEAVMSYLTHRETRARGYYEAQVMGYSEAPTWEQLTDGQRTNVRWLVDRRQDREDLKDVTFALRYGMNPEMRQRGYAALAAFDRESIERHPHRLAGFDLDATQARLDEALIADLTMTPRRRRFKSLMAREVYGGTTHRDEPEEPVKIIVGRRLTPEELAAENFHAETIIPGFIPASQLAAAVGPELTIHAGGKISAQVPTWDELPPETQQRFSDILGIGRDEYDARRTNLLATDWDDGAHDAYREDETDA